MQAFYELSEHVRKRLNIRVDDTWNRDETRVALGVYANTRVLASSRKNKFYVKSPEDHEWVSIVQTVSASGQKIQPLVIFKGKSLQTTWSPSQSIPEWLYTTFENGWTSNAIVLDWLKEVFIPRAFISPERYRLLIQDGQGSHITTEFQLLCKQHKVELL